MCRSFCMESQISINKLRPLFPRPQGLCALPRSSSDRWRFGPLATGPWSPWSSADPLPKNPNLVTNLLVPGITACFGGWGWRACSGQDSLSFMGLSKTGGWPFHGICGALFSNRPVTGPSCWVVTARSWRVFRMSPQPNGADKQRRRPKLCWKISRCSSNNATSVLNLTPCRPSLTTFAQPFDAGGWGSPVETKAKDSGHLNRHWGRGAWKRRWPGSDYINGAAPKDPKATLECQDWYTRDYSRSRLVGVLC